MARTLSNVSLLHWAKNDIPTALQYQQDGLDIEETNLITNLTNGDEVQKRAFLSLYQSSTNGAISFHHQGAPQNQAVADLAYTTLLRRKGRLLDVLGEAYHQLLNSPDVRVKRTLQDLQTTRSQIANLTSRTPGVDKRQQQTYSEQLQNLTTQENQLNQTLIDLSPQFRDDAPDKVQIPAVQQAIPTNAALVEFVEYTPFNPKAKLPQDQWGEPRYAVYVLTRSGSLNWKDLGPVSEIQNDLIKFIDAVQSDSMGKEGLKAAAQPLYQKIFQPIRQMVGGKTHILVSPDGELNRIPFEALIDNQDRYLIRDFQFTYLSSGRDLLKFNSEQPKKLPQAQSSLLLAGPDYNTKTKILPPTQIAQASSVTTSTPRGSTTRSPDLASLTFDFLEGAQAEGQEIAQIDKLKFHPEYGPKATESLLKQWANPQLLHIATHGIFIEKKFEVQQEKQEETSQSIPPLENSPVASRRNQSVLNEKPLLRSGLVLAGFNKHELDTQEDNGLLTAYEVTGLDLRATQMVVMSACQTGTGEIKSGDGVYGLRRAFSLAGAQSQVMSLWDVGDDSTKKLMVAYYQRLSQGEERGAALRQVQLDMLDGKFNDPGKDYTSGNNWAAFIRTGDWRPL